MSKIDQYKDLVIAVDFDDTLFTNAYPDVGEPIIDVINKVKRLQQLGCKLILWTCRGGEPLNKAVQKCNEYGIKFVAINDDEPNRKHYWLNVVKQPQSRKINYDYLIDDRSIELRTIDKLLSKLSKRANSNDLIK